MNEYYCIIIEPVDIYWWCVVWKCFSSAGFYWFCCRFMNIFVQRHICWTHIHKNKYAHKVYDIPPILFKFFHFVYQIDKTSYDFMFTCRVGHKLFSLNNNNTFNYGLRIYSLHPPCIYICKLVQGSQYVKYFGKRSDIKSFFFFNL